MSQIEVPLYDPNMLRPIDFSALAGQPKPKNQLGAACWDHKEELQFGTFHPPPVNVSRAVSTITGTAKATIAAPWTRPRPSCIVSALGAHIHMAKLYFNYSTMNAGKSTLLLQASHNYKERGMQTYLLTAVSR